MKKYSASFGYMMPNGMAQCACEIYEFYAADVKAAHQIAAKRARAKGKSFFVAAVMEAAK